MRNIPCYKILTVIFSVLLLAACRDEAKQERWYPPENSQNIADTGSLGGHWICTDFIELAAAKLSVRTLRTRPLFIEMVFDKKYADSVLLITGYEDFFVPFEKRGADSIVLKNLLPGKDIALYAGNLPMGLQYNDSLHSTGQNHHSWTFVKVPPGHPVTGGGKPSAIYTFLNDAILTGRYLLTTESGKDTVEFAADGSINGWQYSGYTICRGGECFKYTTTPLDIITLEGEAGSEPFAFAAKTNNTVVIYKLERKKKEEYPAEVGKVAYTLVKVQ